MEIRTSLGCKCWPVSHIRPAHPVNVNKNVSNARKDSESEEMKLITKDRLKNQMVQMKTKAAVMTIKSCSLILYVFRELVRTVFRRFGKLLL